MGSRCSHPLQQCADEADNGRHQTHTGSLSVAGRQIRLRAAGEVATTAATHQAQMSAKDRLDERTAYEAQLDLQYAVQLWLLHIRFWRRVRTWVACVTIVGSSFALVSWVNKNPDLTAVAALLLAITSAFSLVVNPAEKQAEARERYRAYAELRSRLANEQDLAALDAALKAAQVNDIPAIEALRVAAYNDTVRSAGRPSYALDQWAWPRMLGLA